jgi:uncharacterized membrane protein
MSDGRPGQDRPAEGRPLEEQLGWLLLAGVVTSAAVLLVGGAVFLARHGAEPVPDRRAFVPQPAEFSRPLDIARAALQGSGRAIIQLGLLLLIATPVARVAYSAAAFARRRDRAYTVIALIVLAVLLYGLLSGHVHG